MAYLNKIDINGRTYYLQHLTDGKNEAMLPTPAKDDQLLLRSQVVNNVTNDSSKNGYYVPLSARQGYLLDQKIELEIRNRELDVAAEEERAMAAEKVLTDNLAQEIVDRTNDVNVEETRALAAEKVLTDNLAQEVIDRTNAVTTEQNRATAKENEISASLTAEINRAKSAEQTNATAIATEQSRAEGVEANHESRIATMETFFKEADIDASQEFIDTLKEIQTYITDDKTGAAAMAASIQANKTAIETETKTARAAEEANADAIAVLNGSDDGSVAKAVADARTVLEAEIAKKLDKTDAYVHPSHDGCASGLYKITVDELGHVSSVVAVTKEDIVGLGIPAQDTTYDDTIASLQEQIDALKALVESYHPTVEPEPEQ